MAPSSGSREADRAISVSFSLIGDHQRGFTFPSMTIFYLRAGLQCPFFTPANEYRDLFEARDVHDFPECLLLFAITLSSYSVRFHATLLEKCATMLVWRQ